MSFFLLPSLFIDITALTHAITIRKAAANILAVDERQSLETLTRDEKTAGRGLTQLVERQQGMEEKKGSRNEELGVLGDRRLEVEFLHLCFGAGELIVFVLCTA